MLQLPSRKHPHGGRVSRLPFTFVCVCACVFGEFSCLPPIVGSLAPRPQAKADTDDDSSLGSDTTTESEGEEDEAELVRLTPPHVMLCVACAA